MSIRGAAPRLTSDIKAATPIAANLIARREETAAMRSQANMAKLLEASSTLMRLRELGMLEQITSAGKLNPGLGEKGLAERLVNLPVKPMVNTEPGAIPAFDVLGTSRAAA